jgi:hypothetical protein
VIRRIEFEGGSAVVMVFSDSLDLSSTSSVRCSHPIYDTDSHQELFEDVFVDFG